MEKKEPLKNTEKEDKLLQLIRNLKFGEIRIYVADGQPVRAEEIKILTEYILVPTEQQQVIFTDYPCGDL